MITLRKLASLKQKTRLRKIINLCQQFEFVIRDGNVPDMPYIDGMIKLILNDPILPHDVITRVDGYRARIYSGESPAKESASTGFEVSASGTVLSSLNSIRFILSQYLGTEPADWDFQYLSKSPGTRCCGHSGTFFVYLDEIRSPFNVGSIFRTAECFGVSGIILSPNTPDPSHPRVKRSAMGCDELISWKRLSLPEVMETAEYSCFALELGGESIQDFSYPEKGLVILGNEELGVSPESLSCADSSSGRVSIDLFGEKGSLNVGVAFGIMMYAWTQSVSRHTGGSV